MSQEYFYCCSIVTQTLRGVQVNDEIRQNHQKEIQLALQLILKRYQRVRSFLLSRLENQVKKNASVVLAAIISGKDRIMLMFY